MGVYMIQTPSKWEFDNVFWERRTYIAQEKLYREAFRIDSHE